MDSFGGRYSSTSFSISFSQSQSQSQSQKREESEYDSSLGNELNEDLYELSEISVPASMYVQQYLTTGCKKLDDFLKGGFPTFGITELVGESGNGKTQLCLQLALTVQLPVNVGGLAAGAIYINTESCFPSSRLVELTEYFKFKYGNHLPQIPMDNILVEHVAETTGLLKCINERLLILMKSKVIRLVIVDSIAALFRADYDEATHNERTRDLRSVGKSLRDLAAQYNVCVIVVNQVSAKPSLGGNIPSLGLAWSNMVTSRIGVARKEDTRAFQVMFAPHLPNTSIKFVISSEQGVQASDE